MSKRIIVGDDRIEWVQKVFPYIPDTDITYVKTPQEVMSQVKDAQIANPFTTIVSDNDYGPGYIKGIELLADMKKASVGKDARKILWTGDSEKPEVQKACRELGVELLPKDQISSLVGVVKNNAPFIDSFEVYIYCNHPKPVVNALDHVLATIKTNRVTVGSDLHSALQSYKYGLVIDTSTWYGGGLHGSVAHDMKYLILEKIPRVVCMQDSKNLLVDIVNQIAAYRKQLKQI